MKIALIALVAVNLLLYAGLQGLFGSSESGREPQRLAQQIEPDQLRMLTAAEVGKLRTAVQPAKDGGGTQSCMEFGDFNAESLAQVQARLAALNLKERLAVIEVEAPGWFLVYLPPLKSRAEADARAREVRQTTNVKDLYVIGEGSPMRNGIALGSFRDREIAASFLAGLEARGVKGARLADRPSTSGATRLRVRDVDAGVAQQLARLQEEFPQQKLSPCSG